MTLHIVVLMSFPIHFEILYGVPIPPRGDDETPNMMLKCVVNTCEFVFYKNKFSFPLYDFYYIGYYTS